MEIIILILLIALVVVYALKKESQENYSQKINSTFSTSRTGDKARIIQISAQTMEQTILLAEEYQRTGRSQKTRELVGIVDLHIRELKRIKTGVDISQMLNIQINVQGQIISFPAFLIVLRNIMRELEEGTGFIFERI